MKLKTIQTLTIFFGKLKPLPLFLSTLDKFTHRIDTFPLQLLCKGLCAVTTLFQFQKPRLSNFRCPLFPSCTFLCLSHASSDRILLLYSHCYPTWFCYNIPCIYVCICIAVYTKDPSMDWNMEPYTNVCTLYLMFFCWYTVSISFLVSDTISTYKIKSRHSLVQERKYSRFQYGRDDGPLSHSQSFYCQALPDKCDLSRIMKQPNQICFWFLIISGRG